MFGRLGRSNEAPEASRAARGGQPLGAIDGCRQERILEAEGQEQREQAFQARLANTRDEVDTRRVTEAWQRCIEAKIEEHILHQFVQIQNARRKEDAVRQARREDAELERLEEDGE